MTMENIKDYETVEYHWVYSELIIAARRRGTVTYQELAYVVGLPITGSYMGRQIGNILGAVSENEAKNGRPMLSAVAVKVDGTPGDGFYSLAQRLGLISSDETQARLAFWEAQKEQIYTIWKQKFPNPKPKDV